MQNFQEIYTSLPEDSFLNKIPSAFDIFSRILFDSISYQIESSYILYKRIQDTLDKINVNTEMLTRATRISIINDMWRIAENIDTLIKLLRKLDPKSGFPIDNFLIKYSNVRKFRDFYAHIHNQLENLSQKKDIGPPVFGSISYRIPRIETIGDSQKMTGFTSITFTAGPQTHQNHDMFLIESNSNPIEHPVGHFELCYASERLNISSIIIDLQNLVEYFDNSVQKFYLEKIKQECEKSNTCYDYAILPISDSIIFKSSVSYI